MLKYVNLVARENFKVQCADVRYFLIQTLLPHGVSVILYEGFDPLCLGVIVEFLRSWQ